MSWLCHDPEKSDGLRDVTSSKERHELTSAGWKVVTATRLGKKMGAWRKRAGLTLKDAEALLESRRLNGMPSAARLRRLLRGGEPLTANELRIVAHVLGLPTAWLCERGGRVPGTHSVWALEKRPRTRKTLKTYLVNGILYVAFDSWHARALFRKENPGEEIREVVPNPA